jgi:hypothetical protein
MVFLTLAPKAMFLRPGVCMQSFASSWFGLIFCVHQCKYIALMRLIHFVPLSIHLCFSSLHPLHPMFIFQPLPYPYIRIFEQLFLHPHIPHSRTDQATGGGHFPRARRPAGGAGADDGRARHEQVRPPGAAALSVSRAQRVPTQGAVCFRLSGCLGGWEWIYWLRCAGFLGCLVGCGHIGIAMFRFLGVFG